MKARAACVDFDKCHLLSHPFSPQKEINKDYRNPFSLFLLEKRSDQLASKWKKAMGEKKNQRRRWRIIEYPPTSLINFTNPTEISIQFNPLPFDFSKPIPYQYILFLPFPLYPLLLPLSPRKFLSLSSKLSSQCTVLLKNKRSVTDGACWFLSHVVCVRCRQRQNSIASVLLLLSSLSLQTETKVSSHTFSEEPLKASTVLSKTLCFS